MPAQLTGTGAARSLTWTAFIMQQVWWGPTSGTNDPSAIAVQMAPRFSRTKLKRADGTWATLFLTRGVRVQRADGTWVRLG